MKILCYIPLLFVISCASRPTPRVLIRPWPQPTVEPADSVRYAEVIRAYHLGRYVDPHHSDLMHEQHPIYRVEAHTRWNLKPGDLCSPWTGPLNPPPDAAHSPPPTNDVVLAELNRQKEATERVMWEALQLARSYDELQKVIKDMSTVATNHAFLSARILNAEKRFIEFEQEFKKLMTPVSAPTNETPALLLDPAVVPTPSP